MKRPWRVSPCCATVAALRLLLSDPQRGHRRRRPAQVQLRNLCRPANCRTRSVIVTSRAAARGRRRWRCRCCGRWTRSSSPPAPASPTKSTSYRRYRAAASPRATSHCTERPACQTLENEFVRQDGMRALIVDGPQPVRAGHAGDAVQGAHRPARRLSRPAALPRCHVREADRTKPPALPDPQRCRHGRGNAVPVHPIHHGSSVQRSHEGEAVDRRRRLGGFSGRPVADHPEELPDSEERPALPRQQPGLARAGAGYEAGISTRRGWPGSERPRPMPTVRRNSSTCWTAASPTISASANPIAC